MTASRRDSASHKLPKLAPMLASTGTAVPRAKGWTFEPKYDGIRVLAIADREGAALISRNGRDKASQFPEITHAVHALAIRLRRRVVLDGEIVARVGRGAGRFQQLQSRIHVADPRAIAREVETAPAALEAFDVLVDGDDVLVDEPWTVRRQRLERVLARRASGTTAALRLARTSRSANRLLAEARRKSWEGIMAKRTDAAYEMGRRSRAWVKLKLQHEQEFVVGGYTEPRRSRPYLGALLLGYFEGRGRQSRLIYAGLCGGGFTQAALHAMHERLSRLERPSSPFTDSMPHTQERVHWVEPRIVVEVRFNEWTADGKLRQPIYLGMRDDKSPRDVRREPASLET